jgi:hypothetical protein
VAVAGAVPVSAAVAIMVGVWLAQRTDARFMADFTAASTAAGNRGRATSSA